MTKERISGDVDRQLRIEADKKANALGISRAKFIEIALESELERFNVHKENKRLTEAKNKAEQETELLRDTCNRLEREKLNERQAHTKTLNAGVLLKEKYNQLESEITQLTEQCETLKAECEKQSEARQALSKEYTERIKQIASHLGVPDTVAHCKQRIDELQVSIEDKKKERDCFKAKFEKADSDYRTCENKLTLLLTRTWWERLWNVLPWIE
ncbi:hypothetical protein F4X10_06520 [Candidatus Poribacteria bacterium]|nr:hypothetical protein [Candidatus Poribacteria bacterium]